MYPDVGGMHRQSFFAHLVTLPMPDEEERDAKSETQDGKKRHRGSIGDLSSSNEVPIKGVWSILSTELSARVRAAFLPLVEGVWGRELKPRRATTAAFPSKNIVTKIDFVGALQLGQGSSPFRGGAGATGNRSAVHVLQEQSERICPSKFPKHGVWTRRIQREETRPRGGNLTTRPSQLGRILGDGVVWRYV